MAENKVLLQFTQTERYHWWKTVLLFAKILMVKKQSFIANHALKVLMVENSFIVCKDPHGRKTKFYCKLCIKGRNVGKQFNCLQRSSW